MDFFGAWGAVPVADAETGVLGEAVLAGTGIVLDAPEVRLVWLPERGDELSDGRLQEIEMIKVSIGA